MTGPFRDPHPGAPRILFIGIPQSSHTHSWMGLLDDAGFNVRLFSVFDGPVKLAYLLPGMPSDWRTPTYVVPQTKLSLDPAVYFPARRITGIWYAPKTSRGSRGTVQPYQRQLLPRVLREWQPDIVHTLGIDPAARLLAAVLQQNPGVFSGRWVLQIRGGSDITPYVADADAWPQIVNVCRQADAVLTDNHWNITLLRDNGLDNLADIAPVPGTGGIDIAALAAMGQTPIEQRNIILLPKGSTSAWAATLATLEGLRLSIDHLPSSHLVITGADKATLLSYRHMLAAWKGEVTVSERVPRSELFKLMAQARVMLAPSLIDGVPNVMYEAMAAGAVPVVSPLQTITPIVNDREHVLFARNLYPQEIADALIQAMTDDALAHQIAATNHQFVHEIADREHIQAKVIDFYRRLMN